MKDHVNGEIGYHEAAKRLLANGYTVAKPDIDRGSDIIVCKDGKCITAQIKNCWFNDKSEVLTTWSGSKNPEFKEAASGDALIIIALDGNLNHLYSMVFSPEEVPEVKSMKLKRDTTKLGKYNKFVNKWENVITE